MSTKRVFLVVLVVSIVTLIAGVQAQPSAQEGIPASVTIPYPGRLADESGRLVADGSFDFSFALYRFETGGEPLWSEVQEGVAVESGSFFASLGSVTPIPKAEIGTESWLAVAVRGPGETEFSALTPRQRLSIASPAAPSSPNVGAACPHDHWGETWSGSGEGLKLQSSDNHGLYASSINSDGLFGSSLANDGVVGFTVTGNGVQGESTDGAGVDGSSSNGYGVQGTSNSAHGVYGITYGEWGWTSGVYGEASKGGANGVTGWNSGSGVGVYGYSASGNAGDFRGEVRIRGHGNTSDIETLRVEDPNSEMGLSVRGDGSVAIGRLSGSASAHICSRIESADARNVFAICSSAAEYVPTVDRGLGFPEAGDLVSIVPTANDPYGDAHAPFAVAKATSPYDPNLVGFISDPELGADGWKHNEDYLPLAIYGYFPVKVTMHNGPIRRGDPITSSPQPGYGMKATKPGRIVGYALEDADQEGLIQVIVQVGDHLGDAPARLDKLEAEVLAAEQEREKLLEQNADLEARLAALEALLAGGVDKGVGQSKQD